MRKFLTNIAEMAARRRILAGGARISPKAKVTYRYVRTRRDGLLQIGPGSIIEGHLVSERDGAKIIIGERSFVGNSLISCACEVVIEDDVLISWGCNLVDHDSHPLSWNARRNDVTEWYRGAKDWTHVAMQPIRIGRKAWLGFNVAVLKGVDIGEGAIVGAGSVVVKSVPAWTVAAGNPARVIRELDDAER